MGGILLSFLPTILSLISKVIPDKGEAARIQGQIMLMQTQGQLSEIENGFKVQLEQLSTNHAEAANPNRTWMSGRELVIYICALGMACTVILFPFISYFVNLFTGHMPLMPNLDTNMMYTILGSLLGLGGLKSFDKYQTMTFDRSKLFNDMRARLGTIDQKVVDAVEYALGQQKW